MTKVLTLIHGADTEANLFVPGAKFIYRDSSSWVNPDDTLKKWYEIDTVTPDGDVLWTYHGIDKSPGQCHISEVSDDFCGFYHVSFEYDYNPSQEGDRDDDI